MTPTNPHAVSVTVNPTFRDFYVGSLILIRYHGPRLMFYAIFPLAGLFLIGLAIYKGIPLWSYAGMRVMLYATLAFAYLPLVMALALWLRLRRSKLLKGPFTYSFDAEGVHTESAAFSQTIKWMAIPRVRLSQSFLFVFVSPISAHCISTDALKEQGVFDEICRLATEHSDFR